MEETVGGGIIASITAVILIILKLKSKNSQTPDKTEINELKKTIQKIEDKVEKNHIDLDNLRGRVNFIEGRLSK